MDDPPPAILDPNPTTTLHTKGNLLLLVGPQPQHRTLITHTSTLTHLGSAWQNVLHTSTRPLLSMRRTAHLPTDDPDMMLVLMYILHAWHLSKVPRRLSFAQLLAMTRLCERYDMNAQVAPFVRRWIVPHQDRLMRVGGEEWLFVARQFGLERHYVSLAQHLVMSCWSDGGRTLFVGAGVHLEDVVPEAALGTPPSLLLPPSLIPYRPRDAELTPAVEIRRKRIRALSIFLDTVYTLIDTLENGSACAAALPPPKDAAALALRDAERALCTHANHGEIIRYLKTHGFWPPIMQAAHITWPVNDVRSPPSPRYLPPAAASLRA